MSKHYLAENQVCLRPMRAVDSWSSAPAGGVLKAAGTRGGALLDQSASDDGDILAGAESPTGGRERGPRGGCAQVSDGGVARQRESTCNGLIPMPTSAFAPSWAAVAVALLATVAVHRSSVA